MTTKLIQIYNSIITYLFAPMPTAKKTRSYRKWYGSEVTDLMHMYEHGLPLPQIAEDLGRSIASIKSKLYSLGYSTKQ